MGPLAGRLLLESWLVPSLIALLLAGAVRGQVRPLLSALTSAAAVPLAVLAVFLAIAGPPESLHVDARTKMMLAAVAGSAVGFCLARGAGWSTPALIVLVGGLPLWVALPALQQARVDTALTILPIGLGLAFLTDGPARRMKTAVGRRDVLPLIALALGLAVIAAFAKALSYTQLCLALGSALATMLLVGRTTSLIPPSIAALAMLLTAATALLLYSDASRLALACLAALPFSGVIGDLAGRHRSEAASTTAFALACLLPAALAVLIARIDAGPFSLY